MSGDGRDSIQADKSARERSDPGRAGAKTGRHRTTPASLRAGVDTQSGPRGHRIWGGSGCCTGLVPDSRGRCPRQIHGLPEKFLTIIAISKAGPRGAPARLMRQLHLRCLITINRPSRRHAIHRPGIPCAPVFIDSGHGSPGGPDGLRTALLLRTVRHAAAQSSIVKDIPVMAPAILCT